MLAPLSMRFKYTFIRIKKQQQHQKEVEKGGQLSKDAGYNFFMLFAQIKNKFSYGSSQFEY